MINVAQCFVQQGDDLHVSCYYIDSDLNAYAISSAQVCCNLDCSASFVFKECIIIVPCCKTLATNES